MTNSFQQNRRAFVVGVLRHEFAAEGFGENGLRELVNVRFRFAVTRFERVSGFEECFDAPDAFLVVYGAEEAEGLAAKRQYC